MDDRSVNRWLLAAIVLSLGAAAVELVIRPPASHPPLPSSVSALASRLEKHPTDWLAACALTETALDSRSPHRFELWRAAHAQALLLAPNRPEPQEAFARSGFFHWTEITAADRKEVLSAVELLLGQTPFWNAMAKPIFDLTGDLSMLRRAKPHTEDAIAQLLSLAATNGRFDDYRALRTEQATERMQIFLSRVSASSPRELIQSFPQPPYRKDLEPLIIHLLRELHNRPLDEDPARPEVIDGIIDYALRHNLRPLDGLEIIVRKQGSAAPSSRLRLAQNLGVVATVVEAGMSPQPPPPSSDPEEWKGLCESLLCYRAWRDVEGTHSIALSLAMVHTDEVPPWVEIYLDDTLVSEGAVAGKRDFVFPVSPGKHRLELQVANPETRNLSRRQLRILSLKAS